MAVGSARIVDERTKAKLGVTFFWPFEGDYWILDLAPNYGWALVGEPSGRYLWVLSRTPHIWLSVAEMSPSPSSLPIFR